MSPRSASLLALMMTGCDPDGWHESLGMSRVALAHESAPPGSGAPDPSADEQVLRGFFAAMTEAWNRGSAEGFAAPFASDADFVAFEGTHLRGHAQIVEFHQQVFDTVMKGSRLSGEVQFVRLLDPRTAVLHGYVQVVLPGEKAPSPSRDSMQLFVARKREGGWRFEALLNARRISLERQTLLDQFDALPEAQQRQVADQISQLASTAAPATPRKE